MYSVKLDRWIDKFKYHYVEKANFEPKYPSALINLYVNVV